MMAEIRASNLRFCLLPSKLKAVVHKNMLLPICVYWLAIDFHKKSFFSVMHVFAHLIIVCIAKQVDHYYRDMAR